MILLSPSKSAFSPHFYLAFIALVFAMAASTGIYADDAMVRPLEELDKFALQNNLDHVWTMTAAGLVFFMQFGFLLLESGMVRSKNSINVAQKNIADFIISTMLFGLVGFMIMFGGSIGGLFGLEWNLFAFDSIEDWTFTFFVFQLVFCGTAATIVSGAAAERTKITAYMLVAAFIGCFMYPVFGHWAWGNLLNGDNPAWLADLGFVDFAGSTVVHSIGAWAALAVIIVVGPRKDRFDENGKPRTIQGHNAVMAMGGALVLWIGWIGFNGGSTTAGTAAFAHIVANTVVAGAAGGMMEMFLGRKFEGFFRPERSINGVLAGLVSITAGCDVVSIWGAIALGAIGAAVAYGAAYFMLHKLKLDDAIGAIPVHGVAGAWGTIGLVFFAHPDGLPAGSMFAQLWVQVVGVLAAFAWGLGTTYVFVKILNTMHLGEAERGIRVSAHDEEVGLNVAEHGASLGTGVLQKAMQELAEGKADLSKRIKMEVGSEAAELAYLFNKIMENMEADSFRMQKIADQKITLEQQQSEERREQEERRLQDEFKAQQRQQELREGMIEKFRQGLNGITDEVMVSVTSLNALAEQMVSAASQSTLEATEASEIVAAANQHIQEVVQTIRSLEAVTGNIEHQVQASDAASSDAATNIKLASQVMERLENSSRSIGQVVKVIGEIAQQTNMLALNATIEASRAGEHGRGFGVVAGEVKSLANQTAQAASQVTAQISEIQAATLEASESLANVRETLTGLSETSRLVFEGIREQSATLGQISSLSSETAEKNAQATDFMSKVIGAGQTTRSVSDEVKRSAGNILEKTEAINKNSELVVEQFSRS